MGTHWDKYTGNRLCISLPSVYFFDKTESFFKKNIIFPDFKQIQILFLQKLCFWKTDFLSKQKINRISLVLYNSFPVTLTDFLQSKTWANVSVNLDRGAVVVKAESKAALKFTYTEPFSVTLGAFSFFLVFFSFRSFLVLRFSSCRPRIWNRQKTWMLITRKSNGLPHTWKCMRQYFFLWKV